MEINMQEMIDYTFDRLVERGYVVDKEAIELVFDIEMDYMESIGLVD